MGLTSKFILLMGGEIVNAAVYKAMKTMSLHGPLFINFSNGS